MFIVKTVPGLEGFSTEQNPVNWEGLKSRNFCLALELLKMAIYRIFNRNMKREVFFAFCLLPFAFRRSPALLIL